MRPRDVPLRDFQAKFGTDSGNWLYNVLRGVEFGEVAAKTDVKSMLSSKNFKPSLRTWEEIVSAFFRRITTPASLIITFCRLTGYASLRQIYMRV